MTSPTPPRRTSSRPRSSRPRPSRKLTKTVLAERPQDLSGAPLAKVRGACLVRRAHICGLGWIVFRYLRRKHQPLVLRGRPGGTSMTKWIEPEAAEYDERRELFNAMIDKKPRIIAACEGSADVKEALERAAHDLLPVAVRSGGHSVAGQSSNDEGLVIDVRPMKAITIDAAARRARVGGGCTWAELTRRRRSSGSGHHRRPGLHDRRLRPDPRRRLGLANASTDSAATTFWPSSWSPPTAERSAPTTPSTRPPGQQEGAATSVSSPRWSSSGTRSVR